MSALLVTMMSLIGPALSFSCDHCRNLPREKTAVCSLGLGGALYYPNCTHSPWDSPGRVFLGPGQPCALLAGMDVLFGDCSYPASVYRASTGEELVGRSLRNVQGEDAGEYVCVETDGKTELGRRNITVSGSVAVTPVIDCSAGGYTCHTDAQSCGWRDAIIVRGDRPRIAEGYVRGLHVYGQRPINTSVAVKWDNPMRRMTPDGLGIQLYEAGDSLLHEFVIFSNGSGHWPETLVEYGNGTHYIDRAIATVYIDAHNSAGSSRLQFKVEFFDSDPSKYYWVDEYLPEHQTVALGDSAQFSCEFSTSTSSQQSSGFNVFVRWRMPSGLEEGCNFTVFGVAFSYDCQISHINITNDPFDYEMNTDRLVLTIRGSVDHVSANDSGSVFFCALATPGYKFEGEDIDSQDLVIQWSNEATLTVGPRPSNIPRPSHIPTHSPHISSPRPSHIPTHSPPISQTIGIGLYVGIPLALVLGAGATLAVVSLLWLKRRKRKSNIESVPLEGTCLSPDIMIPVSTPLVIKNPSSSEQSLGCVLESGSQSGTKEDSS